MLECVVLASLENDLTGYAGLAAAAHLRRFTAHAWVRAEFFAVGWKRGCVHLPSSRLFLSDDGIQALRGNFRSLFKIIFVFTECLSCGWREGGRWALCGWVWAVRGCVAPSQPETLHTVSDPANRKIAREWCHWWSLQVSAACVNHCLKDPALQFRSVGNFPSCVLCKNT